MSGLDPEVLALQPGLRPLEGDLGGLVGLEGAVLRHPGQVPWGTRRPRSYAAPVDAHPGNEAAHQRDHQQDVDGREPRRVVDGEQPELLVDRGQLGVLVAPLRGTQRVHRLLRHHRAGDRGEREQEQQDQRGAHRGQLSPDPPGQLERPHRSGRGPGFGPGLGLLPGHQTPVSKPGKNHPRIQSTSTPHQPVTSSSPTAISITPPMAVTHCWWRRTHPTVPSMWR